MDTERLGRVLGFGARHAAKTVVGAIDAATAPPPAPRRSTSATDAVQARTTSPVPVTASSPAAPVRPVAIGSPSGDTTAHRQPTAKPLPARSVSRGAERSPPASRRGVAEGARRFGRAVWEPAVRLSGVLWLEVTGLFFTLFALIAATAAWHLRGAAHLLSAVTGGAAPNTEAHTQLLIAIGMLAVFGYFAISSFLRASRRSRRR